MTIVLLLCCSCGFVSSSFCQVYHFDRYGFMEGLPHTMVGEVIQGLDKRIYATTPEGLVVYNGTHFELFTQEDNLESNRIQELFADHQGRIWIACGNGGLNYLFQDSIYAAPKIKNALQGKQIYKIFQRADSTLYFVTGLDVLEVRSDTIYSVMAQIQEAKAYGGGSLAALVQDSLLYVVQSDRSILKVNLNNFNWSRNEADKQLWKIIHSMNAIEEGRLFFSGNPGLIEYRDDTFYAVHSHVPGRCWDTDFDENGNLYLFSEGGGFGLFNPQNASYEGYSSAAGVPSNILFGGTIDHESNIWLATLSEGLVRFRDKSLMKYDSDNGVPRNAVSDMAALGDTLYIGSQRGILLLVDDKIGDTLLADEWITSISSSSNHVFVGTLKASYRIYSSGVIEKVDDFGGNKEIEHNQNRFSITTRRVLIRRAHHSDTVAKGWVRALEPLEDAYILMYRNDVALYDGDTTFVLRDFDTGKFGLFRSITSWQNNVIVKSDEYLHRITGRPGNLQIEHFSISSIPEAHRLNAIAIEGDTLWLAGPDQFVALSIKYLIDSNILEFTRFPIAQSFITTAISDDGILVHNGKIYGKNSKGLFVFDPKNYKPNVQAPTLKLMDVKLFGKSLPKSVWRDGDRVFQSSENNISFNMTAHTYVNSKNVLYKYKLVVDGADANWADPSSNNEVVFSGLGDGDYSFEFVADNGFGVWSKNPTRFNFVIEKPIWKKPIFWILFFAGLIVFGLLFVLYVNKKKLADEKALKIKLIEIQEQERIRIARELHDSVGQKIMLTALKAKEIDAHELTELALSSLQETRSISQGLHPVVLGQLGLCDGIMDMVDKIDEYSDVLIDATIEKVDHLIPQDQWIHVFRIIQELLTNCIKHAEATACSIKVYAVDNEVLVSVEDNGKGFDRHAKQTQGIGLHSVRDRVSLLSGRMQIDSVEGTTIEIRLPRIR